MGGNCSRRVRTPSSLIAEGQAAGEDPEENAHRRWATLTQSRSPAELESFLHEDTEVSKTNGGLAIAWLGNQSMVDCIGMHSKNGFPPSGGLMSAPRKTGATNSASRKNAFAELNCTGPFCRSQRQRIRRWTRRHRLLRGRLLQGTTLALDTLQKKAM